MDAKSLAVIGGAGFIGSHFVDSLLSKQDVRKVVIFDNFSSGKRSHFSQHVGDNRLEVVDGEISDMEKLCFAIEHCETLIHLASNPDIAAAALNPEIDFYQGTSLTHAVVEAARKTGTSTILYASGSGVYGDTGESYCIEGKTPTHPISTYGASKLAGDAMLSSYSYMHGIRCLAFRFANVVGVRQTHGVGFDFLNKLRVNPNELIILGDGTQSKSYIHVQDVVQAVFKVEESVKTGFDVFNVSTTDFISVNEIAEIAIKTLGIEVNEVAVKFTGGDRGWKGDVPVIRLDSSKIRKFGWNNSLTTKEALEKSLTDMALASRAV